MTKEIIEIALNAAFSLGQAYWRQADSDRPKDHDKADITLLAFRTLVTNTLTNTAQPKLAELIIWTHDPNDLNTMFQDSAGTIPVQGAIK